MIFKVQSVIIPKSKFSEKEANDWIKKNNYSDKGTKIKNYSSTNYYRFRQLPPSHFEKNSFRTKKLKNGVDLIIGKFNK
jgi:hypothetical protein|tara:strand:+ start:1402 stop:1638 length:237 start_codon:yes stop_codon:yes gene_type:complete